MRTKKFDLDLALRGHPMVTKGGKIALNFQATTLKRPPGYGFMANVDGIVREYTGNGRNFSGSGGRGTRDLRMLDIKSASRTAKRVINDAIRMIKSRDILSDEIAFIENRIKKL
jgi:hypothetical protein